VRFHFVDLGEHVAGWTTWLASRTALVQERRKSTKSPTRHKENPAPHAITAGTKRKYLAAVRSFATYLVDHGTLTSNPIRDVSGRPHHRLHAARHFYVIRAVRAGTPFELVARQLGHAADGGHDLRPLCAAE
jgi:hypothetical protein